AGHVPLSDAVPHDRGGYQCELDLSHEGVLWFHDKGSTTERVSVGVDPAHVTVAQPTPSPPASQPTTSDDNVSKAGTFLPRAPNAAAEPFPMHGVPKETVLQTLKECGTEVVDVQDDRSCGNDWVSYQYFVRRTA